MSFLSMSTIGCRGSSEIEDSYQYVHGLLGDLGFPISDAKLASPTHECHCLGILINTQKYTLSITQEKMKEISDKSEHALQC